MLRQKTAALYVHAGLKYHFAGLIGCVRVEMAILNIVHRTAVTIGVKQNKTSAPCILPCDVAVEAPCLA